MIEDVETAKLWLLRGGDGHRMVSAFLAEGVVGVPFAELPDGRTLDRAGAVRRFQAEGRAGNPEAEAATFLSFVRRIDIGDLVLMPDPVPRGLAIGWVTGDYTFDGDLSPDRCRHRRTVNWQRRLPYADLPERLQTLTQPRTSLKEIPDGRVRALVAEVLTGDAGEDVRSRPQRGRAPAGSGTRRSAARRASARPVKVEEERRCTICLMSKPLSRFEGDSEWCDMCAS